MLELRRLELPGLVEIRPPRFQDDRGFFSETWNSATWRQAGIDLDFVQDNHSLSRKRGVLRGLHFQSPPAAQHKLVRVTRGSAFDVAVDIRSGSPTFGRWLGIIVSAAEWNQILIPPGFAHGFLTLEPETEVQYKVTAPYDAGCDRVVRFDDPSIGIEWPIEPHLITLSERDRNAPMLASVETGF